LGDSIEVDEPIRTNYFIQIIVTVEDVGEFVVNTNSEIIFYSETELELNLGTVIAIKNELCIEQLRVHMPLTVAVSCSGAATFITKIEADGTNVLIVLEGEVEFSDPITLTAGTYFLCWLQEGSDSTPSQNPPVTINGVIDTGNALAYVDEAWIPAADRTGGLKGMPFVIQGTSSSAL